MPSFFGYFPIWSVSQFYFHYLVLSKYGYSFKSMRISKVTTKTGDNGKTGSR